MSIIIFFSFIFLFYKNLPYGVLLLLVCFSTLKLFIFNQLILLDVLVLIAFLFVLGKACYRRNITSFPFKTGFLAAFSSYVLTFLFTSTRVSMGSFLSILSAFMLSILVWSTYDNSLSLKFKRLLFIYLGCLAVYGLYEAFTMTNPILDYLVSRNNIFIAEQADDYVRFGLYRARSLTSWCSTFGTVCGVGFIYYLYNFLDHNYTKKNAIILIMLLSLSGVFACGTRSVITMVLIMSLCCVKYIQRIRIFIAILVVVSLGYFSFQDFFDQIFVSFVDHEHAGGSSLDLRSVQFLAAYSFFQENPIFGNGIGYTYSFATESNSSLMGAESIIFTTMIDRGFWGIVSILFLWVSSIVFLVRNKLSFLSFLVIGLAVGKIISSLIGIPETFIYPYVILLMKDRLANYTNTGA